MYLRCLLLVALIGATATAGPRLQSPWDPILSHTAERPHHGIRPLSLDEDSLHRYNTLKLAPHLSLDFNTNVISGFMMADLVADELPLSRIDLRLQSALTVDSVWTTGVVHSVTYTRDGFDSLQILLTPASCACRDHPCRHRLSRRASRRSKPGVAFIGTRALTRGVLPWPIRWARALTSIRRR